MERREFLPRWEAGGGFVASQVFAQLATGGFRRHVAVYVALEATRRSDGVSPSFRQGRLASDLRDCLVRHSGPRLTFAISTFPMTRPAPMSGIAPR